MHSRTDLRYSGRDVAISIKHQISFDIGIGFWREYISLGDIEYILELACIDIRNPKGVTSLAPDDRTWKKHINAIKRPSIRTLANSIRLCYKDYEIAFVIYDPFKHVEFQFIQKDDVKRKMQKNMGLN